MIKFKDNLSQIVKDSYRVSKNGVDYLVQNGTKYLITIVDGVEVYTEVTNTKDVSDESQFTFLKPGNYDITGI